MEQLFLTSTPVTKHLETMPMGYLLAAQARKPTMLYWLLDMELRKELISGWSRTLGAQAGVTVERSRSGVEPVSAASGATAMLPSVPSQLELSLIHQSLLHPSQSPLNRSVMFQRPTLA